MPKVKKDESWNRSIGGLSKKNALTNLVKSKKTKDIPSKAVQSSEVSVEAATKTPQSSVGSTPSQSIGVVLKSQNDSSTSESVLKPSGLTLLASYSGSDSDSQ